MDNFTDAEKKREQLIIQIQEFARHTRNMSDIARKFDMDRRTIKKYINGNPKILCKDSRKSLVEPYKKLIINFIQHGLTQNETTRQLQLCGCKCKYGTIKAYISKIVKEYNLNRVKYISKTTSITSEKIRRVDYITRKNIFEYLWMNKDLNHKSYIDICCNYPVLREVESCIKEFRRIFIKKNMPLLYLFVYKYKKSNIKELRSFAYGLEKDIEAVENAVASELSNGFVEGTNNKLKMIKRIMYGRCSKKLLEAKLVLSCR